MYPERSLGADDSESSGADREPAVQLAPPVVADDPPPAPRLRFDDLDVAYALVVTLCILFIVAVLVAEPLSYPY